MQLCAILTSHIVCQLTMEIRNGTSKSLTVQASKCNFCVCCDDDRVDLMQLVQGVREMGAA